MPDGVVVEVEDGFAIIDFVDRKKRGPGLRKLVERYGPEVIETLTRTGPRRMYRVPEGNAREVGLIDTPPVPAAPVAAAPAVTYDDGFPDADWHRAALDEYAEKIGIANAAKLPNKTAVLSAIRARISP